MANDFFDGLGETLSRTAKELGERAENLYEIQKIRNKISSEERQAQKLMTDIGNLIFQRYLDGEEMDGDIAAFCEEIQQHHQLVAEYKDKSAELRGKKVCMSCKKEIERSAAFCPYCGCSCPTPETEETPEEETAEAAPEEAPEEETAEAAPEETAEAAPEETAEAAPEEAAEETAEAAPEETAEAASEDAPAEAAEENGEQV